jgi:hypothetical protein
VKYGMEGVLSPNSTRWRPCKKRGRHAKRPANLLEKNSIDIKHPLFEEIKTESLRFATNHELIRPKSNLNDAEQRVNGWVLDAIKNQKIFASSADKQSYNVEIRKLVE